MESKFECEKDYWPRIPDASYMAQCVSYNEKRFGVNSLKLFLHFRIIDPGEHEGKQIFMAFNMPVNGKIKSGSKYYKTWVLVNGNIRPSRKASMSPRLFKNKIFKVKTRTVKPLSNNKTMPEQFWYSVVDYIISVEAPHGDSRTTPLL